MIKQSLPIILRIFQFLLLYRLMWINLVTGMHYHYLGIIYLLEYLLVPELDKLGILTALALDTFILATAAVDFPALGALPHGVGDLAA